MATSVQMIEKPAFATTWTQTPVEVNKNSLVNEGSSYGYTTKLGLRNLLKVPTSNTDNYFLTRQCSYIFYCARIKAIVDDDRVQEAIEKTILEELQDASLDLEADGRLYLSLLSKYKKQAIKTIKNMKAALSSTLIRITGYVLFKVFNFLFMSVTVNEGQLQMIEAASKRNIPLIFVPLHRSHVDYLFVTWILFNREIPAPIVAAGDNLRMPVFG
ncbi:Glycerol-3-phosphate acyltransferase 1, mitochondrial [Armadillidium vulgare]|nr:Glycerol-3-phosphate acyltransferase 1, mitochondrial [Armadillidium vulgare]